MRYKNPEPVELPSWVKESQKRGEEITVYMVNDTTGEVVFCGVNPNFIAGVMRFGETTMLQLIKAPVTAK